MVEKYGWEMFLQPFIDEANQLYDVRSLGKCNNDNSAVIFFS